MKVFINDGVCKRKDIVKIEELPNSKLMLSIPNYLESEKGYEYIRFIFSNISRDRFDADLLLDNASLIRAGKNKYYIIKDDENNMQNHMYILFRSTAGNFDDIYIPTIFKEKIRVLRKITFWEQEINGEGNYLSNIYLVRVKLEIGERIPIYFAYGEHSILKAYYPIYRPRWDGKYHIGGKMETLIFITKDNYDEYISLSRLVNNYCY